MSIRLMMEDLLKNEVIGTQNSACTNQYTKLKLERARKRRKQSIATSQKCRHDNSLASELESNLRRTAHADVIGFCYWTRGKEALTHLAWPEQEWEFLASLLPESQMNRLLGNYVLRHRGQEALYRSAAEVCYPVDDQCLRIGLKEAA